MSLFSIGGLSMQLPIERAYRTDLPPRKFEVAEDDLDLRPPSIFKPVAATDSLVAYREFQPIVDVPSDYMRASVLRWRTDQQKDDRVALNAWLEAFTGFNTDFDVVGGFLPNNTGYRNRSGTPCQTLPRVVKGKDTRADGSKRRKRQKVGHLWATMLEPGDHWGPHSGDQYPPKTQLKYQEAVEASKKMQADVAERHGPLHVVKDKGQYKGPQWSQSTMSKQVVVQGFEEWARPPTLVELWADHWKRLQNCPITDETYEYKSSIVFERDEKGVPVKIQTEVVNWKVRDGAALGPTPGDSQSKEWYDDGTPINHGIMTEGKAVIGEAQNQPDYSQYATPMTPLQEKLETGTEIVNFTAISMKDASVAKRVGKLTLDQGLTVNVPQSVMDSPRFKQSRGWTKTLEDSRWDYKVQKGCKKFFWSERTKYLAWLEERDVHNVGFVLQEFTKTDEEEVHGSAVKYLGRELMGARQGYLLARTLGCERAFDLAESYMLNDVPDDVRYRMWHAIRGDEALAQARACIHRSKSLQLYPEVIPQFMGPPCPPRVRQLAQINIVDRLTYDEMEREKPITEDELEAWMDSVANQFGGGLDEHVKEFMLRTGTLDEKGRNSIQSSMKKDPVSGIYVPLDMEIIRPDLDEILKGHINDVLFQEKAKEVRERYSNRPKSIVDRAIELFQYLQ